MIDINNVIVIGDRVLIKPEEDLEKTNSGLYLPPGVREKEKVMGGYILKVGPGIPIASQMDEDEPWKEKGGEKYIPLQAKPGDFALFLKSSSYEIELKKEKVYIVPQAALLLLMRDEELLS